VRCRCRWSLIGPQRRWGMTCLRPRLPTGTRRTSGELSWWRPAPALRKQAPALERLLVRAQLAKGTCLALNIQCVERVAGAPAPGRASTPACWGAAAPKVFKALTARPGAGAGAAGGRAAGRHKLGELRAGHHRQDVQVFQGQGVLRRRAAAGGQPDDQLRALPAPAVHAHGAAARRAPRAPCAGPCMQLLHGLRRAAAQWQQACSQRRAAVCRQCARQPQRFLFRALHVAAQQHMLAVLVKARGGGGGARRAGQARDHPGRRQGGAGGGAGGGLLAADQRGAALRPHRPQA